MNTDMNQYLIFRLFIGMLIYCCKKNDSLSTEMFVLGLAYSPFVLTEHISSIFI